MYESFFGLTKRPFAATPDVGCFVPVEESYQAFSRLAQCAADGQGIGVLTAPAGMGKTLIAQRVICELEGQFVVVFLPTGNFLTRRSLLQAVLFELGHSFIRMGDQELRLALTSALRRVRPNRRGVVLIVDEAHLLAARMLEELRTLTNIAESGEPLIRLIVSGQLSLEETLSQPSLAAFNQRVGCQATLLPLTRDESIEYISRRLAWAGGNLSEILDGNSLATICEASDGSPRCLNQLCDHSLLLAYLASEKPVSTRKVRQALDDLKQLPLTWNEPASGRLTSQIISEMQSHKPTASQPRWNSEEVENGGRQETTERAADSHIAEIGTDWGAPSILSDERDGSRPQTRFNASDAQTPVYTWDVEPSAPRVAEVAAAEADGTVEFGEAPVDLMPSSLPLAFEAATMLPASNPGSTDAGAGPTMIDEEVVVDRYAALDAAVSRLARTMLCARAVVRRSESILPAPSRAAASQVADDEKSITAVYDVVMPEDTPVERTTTQDRDSDRVPMPIRHEERPQPRSGERRYQYLFSELRRRRGALSDA